MTGRDYNGLRGLAIGAAMTDCGDADPSTRQALSLAYLERSSSVHGRAWLGVAAAGITGFCTAVRLHWIRATIPSSAEIARHYEHRRAA